jgi:adenylate cyclase
MLGAKVYAWVRPRLYHLFAPLIALALVYVIDRETSIIQVFEYVTVNLRFKTRQAFDPPADPRLVFVQIDEFSLNYIGKWPWPRRYEAEFINQIGLAHLTPSVVSFDIMFTEDTNKAAATGTVTGPDDDQQLGNALSLFPAVTGALTYTQPDDPAVAANTFDHTRAVLANPGPTQPLTHVRGDIQALKGSDYADFPVDPVRAVSAFGFVNDEPSPIDDIRHTIPLVVRVQGKVFPSLALQTLCQMLQVDADKVEVDLPNHVVRMKSFSGQTWNVPVDDAGQFSINYRRQTSFQAVSLGQMLQNLGNHTVHGEKINPACDVSGKALLVGEAATALGDMGPSPLEGRSPLPYAHLNVMNNILKNDYLTFAPWWLVVFGWVSVTWPTLIRLKVATLGEAVAVPIVLSLVYIVGTFAVFWLWSIQVALFWPVASYGLLSVGGVILRWREERRGREQIKQVFSRMVSPEIMNYLLDHPDEMKLGGSDRRATVLFSDIRDYTKFSEGLEAEEVVRQLNVYFERMVPCVTECKGTFHKFIGDAIMAAWGDIEATSQGPEADTRNAIRSALLMRERLRELNAERVADKLVALRVGIGLNHGPVQAGMLGSSGRMEFTVMGDAVNTASRLEGLTKEFKTDLAVSESVRHLLGDEFLVRRLGLIVLKGKTTPTVVFEVLAAKEEIANARLTPAFVARYEEAFDHFLARRFAEAEAGFVACAKEHPEDHCTVTYLAACREFLVTPPAPDWDGRIVMTTK